MSLDNRGPYKCFDLILADYTLPGFDALSALRLAREKCPEVPFMIVSGTIDEDAAVELLKNGATDYVLKDRLSRLLPAARRAIKEAEERRERKRLQKEVELQEERLNSFFKGATAGLVLMDRDLRFRQHDNPFEEMMSRFDQAADPAQSVRGYVRRADFAGEHVLLHVLGADPPTGQRTGRFDGPDAGESDR